MPEKKLTGRIAADRIRMQSTPKPPAGSWIVSSRSASAPA
jgi:hypothetical protein